MVPTRPAMSSASTHLSGLPKRPDPRHRRHGDRPDGRRSCLARRVAGVQRGCVVIIASVVLPALMAGCSALLLTLRWPRADPSAPRLDEASPLLRREVLQHPRLRMLLRHDVDPAVVTSATLVVEVAALVVFTACIGALLIMVETSSGLARWDACLARWGADNGSPGSTTALRGISQLGGTVGVLTIAFVGGTIEYLRRPNRALPPLLALTVLGQFAICAIVKTAVGRDRPDIRQLTGFSGDSFPSGHAAASGSHVRGGGAPRRAWSEPQDPPRVRRERNRPGGARGRQPSDARRPLDDRRACGPGPGVGMAGCLFDCIRRTSPAVRHAGRGSDRSGRSVGRGADDGGGSSRLVCRPVEGGRTRGSCHSPRRVR